jgi:hypothetical protein
MKAMRDGEIPKIHLETLVDRSRLPWILPGTGVEPVPGIAAFFMFHHVL